MSKAKKIYAYNEDGEYIRSYGSKQEVCSALNANRGSLYRAIEKGTKHRGYYWSHTRKVNLWEPSDDVVEENIILARKAQRLQDTNRIERASFRGYARWYNAVESFTESLVDVLSSYNFSDLTVSHPEKVDGPIGMIHFTDVHFNELISIPTNQYTFEIAATRARLFIERSITYLEAMGCTQVVFALGGDMLNSDRRLDELLNQHVNRSEAMFLAVNILQQMVIHLNEHFNVSVVSVCGNESRAGKDIQWSAYQVTDNYDWTIHNMLKILFQGSDVQVITGDDPLEVILDLNGQNVLLLHGHQNKMSTEAGIHQIIGKYASQGMGIDFVVYGHIHSAKVSDFHARGGGLPGGNAYSDRSLQLASRASQNIHIFYKNGLRDSIKVDLQVVAGRGYNIIPELEAYHSKSEDKASPKTTIMKIVI